MTIEEKVLAVEELFVDLDREILSFQQQSGLTCGYGCGKCCFKSDIEATALEFLPFAYALYQEGSAEQWYELLRGSDESVCRILDPSSQARGLCTRYKHRGLICRLFGYSARISKYGERELVTCRIMKEEQATQYEKARVAILEGSPVPVMSDYYRRLFSIDPDLSREFYPINKAIQRAIEQVLHYFAYRR